ncbi:MAG: pyridoxamine 5'-phosphate oxidase family protein, partial [Waterburya sp.]
PNSQELKATNVLSFPIEEGSAKVRTGDPNDDVEDYSLPFWAGQLPLKLTPGIPLPDSKLSPKIALPENLINYHRGV